MPGVVGRPRGRLPGVAREDSDDELGSDDLPWEWVYEEEVADEEPAAENGIGRKRKRPTAHEAQIIGARIGSFECYLGDTVLLKADGSNEAWVGIICDFVQADEDGEKAANFMWFSSAHELRSPKKRTDFLEVRALSAARLANVG
jgi:origin recognition complex subunit 1